MFSLPYICLTRLVPAISTHRALSRFSLQVLHTGLNAISLPFRQILGCTNSRAHSRVEVKQSRLYHFRQHRSHCHKTEGTCSPPPGHPGCPFNWISTPFPIEYAYAYYTTLYVARYIPQLGTRALYTRCTPPSLPWAAPRNSSCRRTWTKRSWQGRIFDIWS